MDRNGTWIEDTFAEAFRMHYVRLLITAADEHWLAAAVAELTGYSASVIGCDAEAGCEARVPAGETPDGRPGAAVLLFGFNPETLAKAVPNRVGQCVMTCPTTSVFDGAPELPDRLPLGRRLRYFGDGFQKSKRIADRRYWRIPVMDGEFLVEDRIGVGKGVGGGNLIVQGADQVAALHAARRAAATVAEAPGVMTPFPGGVVRSGSKVGSRYRGLPASTADAYCPSLRGRVESKLHEGAECAYEIVIDGIGEEPVASAMRGAIDAVCGEGIVAVTAGNYGGKLGKFHFHLRELLAT